MKYLDKTVAGNIRISSLYAHRVRIGTWMFSLQDNTF
jgi:hypothetical protein